MHIKKVILQINILKAGGAAALSAVCETGAQA